MDSLCLFLLQKNRVFFKGLKYFIVYGILFPSNLVNRYISDYFSLIGL